MGIKKLVFLMAVICLSNSSFGQTDELNTNLQKLQGLLTRVLSGTKAYDQQIKPLQFGAVQYIVEETDQKGAKTVNGFEFNLADIDPYAVRQETQKDVILVNLTVRNKQKLVKVSKNQEVTAYDELVKIRAANIDNARDIIDAIKKCIPPAEKVLADKLKLSGYDAMVNWLTANTKNVELGAKSIQQTLVKADYVGSLKLTEIETDSKGSVEEQYTFNLADINLNSVNFKISGNKFGINFDIIQNVKAISTVKGGKSSFVSELTINTNNVDEARDIKTVLAMVVPLAIEKVKADNPKTGTNDETLNALKTLVKDVKGIEKSLTQSVDAKCVTTITQTSQTPNATVKDVYTFNWMDINLNITKIGVTGDRMFLEAPALDKKTVIMHYKNDKFDGYENEVNIYAENIEVARRLKFVTDKAIEKCKTSYKEPFTGGANEAFGWLKKTIGEVVIEESSMKQTFESAGTDNENKVKYNRVSIKGNTSSEEIFEFNFADINPTTVEVLVKGKWLYVRFETNFKAKIISAYKDGKIQPYTSSLEIAIKDVESSRDVTAAFKKCIDAFKSK